MSIPNPITDTESELTLPVQGGREKSVARGLALQIMYEADCTRHQLPDIMKQHQLRGKFKPLTQVYLTTLVEGITEHQPCLDQIIQRSAATFPVKQLAIIDRNILRIALFEFGILQGLSVGIVVSEALKLGDNFGSDGTTSFINGVLGSVLNDQDGLQVMLDTC